MNKNKILYTAIIFFLTAASCKKDFFVGANTNPNASTTVTPNLLLSTIEGALGYVQGGDFSRNSSMLDQQTYGYANQSAAFYFYQINSGNFDNQWGGLYTSVMENDYKLLQQSDENGYNYYSGIARIIMAYSLQLLVDNWGNVPYKDAFQADNKGTLTPTYNDAKALYDTINNLINKAITQLGSSDAGVFSPGADDYIYGGNTDAWIKFGHAIKARLYIHQSKGDAAMAANAIAEINKSFTGNDDNAQFVFGKNQTEANSWYQFGRDRQGYIVFSLSTLNGILTDLNDPRYSIFIDPDNDGGGVSPSGTYFGGLPDYYGSVSSPVEFITYDELLFTKAEATLRSSGDIAAAQMYYRQAITANMQKLGIATADIATYIAANGTLPANINDAISKVALQEYIALYLNPEAYTLYRRTNVPNLQPAGTGGIPRRLIYPLSESQFNPNTPQSTLYAPKIFWDK